MVALLSPSSTKLRRRRKTDPTVRSLPATLLTGRISELHRKLIDPTSRVENVRAAKHSLLRLLSDPMTLPVITTPAMAMAMPVAANTDTEREPIPAERLCELCKRPLSTISNVRHEGITWRARKRSTSSQRSSLQNYGWRPTRANPLSVRTPRSPKHSLS